MSDIMRPIPFSVLLERMLAELREESSIFGISSDQFFRAGDREGVRIFSQQARTPIGPAAGPHTQLAQNIICSYLSGGRFIELKTVQRLDHLVIEKPCIDARDEGYNVEWSTEYTLEGAYQEYVKAWIVLHLLDDLLEFTHLLQRNNSFVFNMSIGYDLEGIKTPGMQTYIDEMVDATSSAFFQQCLMDLELFIHQPGIFDGTVFEGLEHRISGLTSHISPNISPTVTLSTMHGCPPDEIEAICTYLLVEKQLDTFVKLNPTLLGYAWVRSTLDELGYDQIHLSESSFDHDLHYPDACAMISRLMHLAASVSRHFGVKLTNTLGTKNDGTLLPGREKYLSGRALYPLSIELAARLAEEFDGKLPISYSGGVSAHTVASLFETGIHPITFATTLLQPGGYGNMYTMALLCEEASGWTLDVVDPDKVRKLADEARTAPFIHKRWKGEGRRTLPGELPLFDCYVAPCVEACPIHQDVPEYLYLVGEGRYDEALELIMEKNPLPNITGHICDHQCMFACSRIDYEGAVNIRDMKRIAADLGSKGEAEYEAGSAAMTETREAGNVDDQIPVAVIGAGPAGLSAAYFLAREGFSVTLFEREKSAGGVVEHIIPRFRLPGTAILKDIQGVLDLGVTCVYGVSESDIMVKNLHDKGFQAIFYALGAEHEKPFRLEGDSSRVIGALDYLKLFRNDPDTVSTSGHVIVIGGGNTAMDSARAVLSRGAGQVTLLYRRTEHEMPADREEYENALAEGMQTIFLAAPERFDDSGALVCRSMRLGEVDASGRRSPIPTDESFTLQADLIITAIGEQVDSDLLRRVGYPLDAAGKPIVAAESLMSPIPGVYLIGDAQSGPSTVVQCIASARRAVDHMVSLIDDDDEDDEGHGEGHSCSCGEDHTCGDDCSCSGDHEHHEHDDHNEHDDAMRAIEKEFFDEIRNKKISLLLASSEKDTDEQRAAIESQRCLECSYICNRCVDVCPNRANFAIDVRELGMFENPYQILHIDAFCNECGNCTTWCPWSGEPYKDKFTIFASRDDLMASAQLGIYVGSREIVMRDLVEDSPIIVELAYVKHDEGTITVDGDVDELTSEFLAYLIGSYHHLFMFG